MRGCRREVVISRARIRTGVGGCGLGGPRLSVRFLVVGVFMFFGLCFVSVFGG